MTKSEILFELRNHIHFLSQDEIEEILDGEVEFIERTQFNNYNFFTINFTKGKQFICNDAAFRFWYLNQEYHRDDGKPAIIYPDGSMEWWVHGKRIK